MTTKKVNPDQNASVSTDKDDNYVTIRVCVNPDMVNLQRSASGKTQLLASVDLRGMISGARGGSRLTITL